MRKIYSALDIGSSFIKLVVGEFLNGKLNVLCAVKKETKGFKNNQIINEDLLIKSLNSLLNEASNILNFKLTKIVVNIPTDYNEFLLTEARIPINEKVTSNDILKVLQNASLNQVKPNDELLVNNPIYFRVDDEETVSPYGMNGKSLYVKSVLVTTDKKRVYDLIKVLEKCELEVIDITTTGLVDYYNFRNKDLDTKNSVIINIGGTTTNISIFNKGIYINNICLDAGGQTIDKEIVYTYNIRKKDAIYLKENLALAINNNADIKDSVTLTDKDGKEIKINQYEISSLVNKKLIEMLKNIKNNINYLTKKEISYIIITGGLSELKDISHIINRLFKNAHIGKINDIGARDNSYSVALGCLKYFNYKLSLREKDFGMLSDDEIELMMSNDSKLTIAKNTIIGKVFNYFFDN